MNRIDICTEYITVSAFLKLAGAVMSGGEAGDAISRGLVKVDGEICVQKRKKLFAGQVVGINGIDYEVVKKCT